MWDMCGDCRAALAELRHAATTLSSIAAVNTPTRLADIDRTIAAADILTRVPAHVDTTLLLSDQWNSPNPTAEDLARKIEALQRLGKELGSLFREGALNRSI